jgi:hypothetical protein
MNSNLISSFIGSFFAAILFWFIIEQRIKNIVKYTENRKFSKKFLEELLYNRIVATKIVESEKKYLETKEFTFLKYETKYIDGFLIYEPLSLDRDFYMQAEIIASSAFKKDNMLIDIFWFAPNATDPDRDNYKKVLINNAKQNIKNIDKVISNKKFSSEMQRLGLTEEVQSEVGKSE